MQDGDSDSLSEGILFPSAYAPVYNGYRIHKEQMEKWQEEIKQLRMIDTTNEEMNDRLYNAKCLLQNVDKMEL